MRPEVGFGLARSRKQPCSGICRCPSTRNGPLIDPRFVCTLLAANLSLYYGTNRRIWPLAVSLTQGNRPNDARELLDDMEEPAQNLTSHLKDGHWTARGRHASKVCGLGLVARVYGTVWEEVRVLNEVVKSQNIMLGQHG